MTPNKLSLAEVEKRTIRYESLKMVVAPFWRQLTDTMRENERLQSAIRQLEPLRDIDWHGKWRIQSALDVLDREKEPDNVG